MKLGVTAPLCFTGRDFGDTSLDFINIGIGQIPIALTCCSGDSVTFFSYIFLHQQCLDRYIFGNIDALRKAFVRKTQGLEIQKICSKYVFRSVTVVYALKKYLCSLSHPLQNFKFRTKH